MVALEGVPCVCIFPWMKHCTAWVHLHHKYSIYRHELNHVQQAGAGATWPMLPVETEVNGDSKSTNERSPFLVGSLGFSCQYKRFLSCLGCSSRPSRKYYFPHHTLFQLIRSLRPSKLGRGSCWVACLLVYVSGSSPLELCQKSTRPIVFMERSRIV